jgi:hypothetical protein
VESVIDLGVGGVRVDLSGELGSVEDVIHTLMGEHEEGSYRSKTANTRGEAGEEEGGVRGEDEEPGSGDPQGGGGEEGDGGGDAARGDNQV